MKIYGLLAGVRLAKRYEFDPEGGIQKKPYPMAYRFRSMDFGPQLGPAIAEMSRCGGCLIKGELDRALVDERRAGHTNARQDTQWICLDLDGISAWQNVDHFLSAIGCAGVDYVLQWS